MKNGKKIIAFWMALLLMMYPVTVFASSIQNNTTPRIVTGTSSVAAPVINVTLPTALPIVLDPNQINGRTQIFSSDFAVINRSNTNVVVTNEFWLTYMGPAAAPIANGIFVDNPWHVDLNHINVPGPGYNPNEQTIQRSHNKRAFVAVQFAHHIGTSQFTNTTQVPAFSFEANYRHEFRGRDGRIRRTDWDVIQQLEPQFTTGASISAIQFLDKRLQDIPGVALIEENVFSGTPGATVFPSGGTNANIPMKTHFLLSAGEYVGTAMAGNVFGFQSNNLHNMVGAFNIVGNLSNAEGVPWVANDIRVNARFTITPVSTGVLDNYRWSSDPIVSFNHTKTTWNPYGPDNFKYGYFEEIDKDHWEWKEGTGTGWHYGTHAMNAYIGELFNGTHERIDNFNEITRPPSHLRVSNAYRHIIGRFDLGWHNLRQLH
jgi:hypothetical protein